MAERIVDETNEGIRWPDPKTGPFFLRAHWADVDNQAECVGIEIWKLGEPTDGGLRLFGTQKPAGLTARDLRKVPLESVLRKLWDVQAAAAARRARAYLAHGAERLAAEESSGTPRGEAVLTPWARSLQAAATAAIRTSRLTFSKDGPEHFKEVAEVYRQAVADRRPPTKAVASEWSKSHSTAAKWVAKARALGFLEETSPGQPSAAVKPTPRKRTTKGDTR